MRDEKILMAEAATLYYEKKLTQQEIARLMNLSRQTVSKLLSDAVQEKIVEIKIHNPEKDRQELSAELQKIFSLQHCIVCGVSSKGEDLRQIMTVQAAATYLTPLLARGGQKIALSWGRTVQALIDQLPNIPTEGNTVFPLFGATDSEQSYFSSNELARNLGDKLGAKVNYAWFPYLPDSREDYEMLKKLSHFKKMESLWDSADLAIVGIGNKDILKIFQKTFGDSEKSEQVIGDIATHFFTQSGEFADLYKNSLCASRQNLKNAKQAIAIACGDNKIDAICGALRTGLICTLITDEYTAKQILQRNT